MTRAISGSSSTTRMLFMRWLTGRLAGRGAGASPAPRTPQTLVAHLTTARARVRSCRAGRPLLASAPACGAAGAATGASAVPAAALGGAGHRRPVVGRGRSRRRGRRVAALAACRCRAAPARAAGGAGGAGGAAGAACARRLCLVRLPMPLLEASRADRGRPAPPPDRRCARTSAGPRPRCTPAGHGPPFPNGPPGPPKRSNAPLRQAM